MPIVFPIFVVVVISRVLNMFGIDHSRRFGRIKALEMSPTGPLTRRHKPPRGISQNIFAKFGEMGIVFLQLFSSVNVVVVVIHGAIGIEPTLHAFRPILRPVLVGIAFLGAPPKTIRILSSLVTLTLESVGFPFTRISPLFKHFLIRLGRWSGKDLTRASKRLTGVLLFTRRNLWAARHPSTGSGRGSV